VRRAYGLLPWGLIALGLLHMAATWRLFPSLTPSALWFFNGGIMLLFTGVLNLINRAHGAGAPSLRWFCRGVNLVMLCFAALAGVVGKATAVQLAVILTLIGAITLLSAFRPALNPVAPRSLEEL
jgi:hypothetical protein